MELKAELWDWDGLAADTEPLWSKADKKWLCNNGIEYNDEYKAQLTARGQKDCVTTLIEAYGLKLSVLEAIKQRLTALREVYDSLEENILMPGASRLMRASHESGMKLAIVSGSSQDILDCIVSKQGVRDYFKLVMSTDGNVKKGKPAPDCYLEAAKRLNVLPNECVVLEDAESGVVAAKEAGIVCIAIPNRYTSSQDFSRADKIVASLEDLTPGSLRSLVAGIR